MRPLPYARQLVGWMLLLCGVLLALGLLLREGISIYLWAKAGASTADLQAVLLFVLNALGLVAAGLLARYGWRLLRGDHIRSGPGGRPIL